MATNVSRHSASKPAPVPTDVSAQPLLTMQQTLASQEEHKERAPALFALVHLLARQAARDVRPDSRDLAFSVKVR